MAVERERLAELLACGDRYDALFQLYSLLCEHGIQPGETWLGLTRPSFVLHTIIFCENNASHAGFGRLFQLLDRERFEECCAALREVGLDQHERLMRDAHELLHYFGSELEWLLPVLDADRSQALDALDDAAQALESCFAPIAMQYVARHISEISLDLV